MKQNEFKIFVVYQGKEYPFEYGSQAYIFHTGIYNEIHTKYGMDVLLSFTELVHNCYMSDDNRTPLGELADYVAEHWDEVKGQGKRDILEAFYIYNE